MRTDLQISKRRASARPAASLRGSKAVGPRRGLKAAGASTEAVKALRRQAEEAAGLEDATRLRLEAKLHRQPVTGKGKAARPEAIIRARIDAGLKDRATRALAKIGLTPSDAIRLLMRRVAKEGRLPLTYNAETVAALTESRSGGGRRYDSTEEMFKDILG